VTAASTATPRKPAARLLAAPFFADRSRTRLRHSGDFAASRAAFIERPFKNLDYLLRRRYAWMAPWLEHAAVTVEVGAGAGLLPRYLKYPVILSDIEANPWLDLAMDGTRLALRDAAVDALIVSNALHHFAAPARFLQEATRVLKPNGLILLNDAFCSLLLRIMLRLAKHEGYSYDVDVFDPAAIANDPADPWSGNNAVSNLLFDDREQFATRFPELRIVHDAPCEAMLFLASGGVTAQVSVPALPEPLLAGIARFDELLVGAAPRLFALCRRTVLQKTAARCGQ
jgi:SAM-dependent methyltransferase